MASSYENARIDSARVRGLILFIFYLKTAAKTVFLAALSFAVAAAVGATPLPRSYALSLLFSVVLCPVLLGLAGGRGLRLGPVATLVGINFMPVVMALDQRFHLHAPTGFFWLAASFVFAWAGWRLGRRAPAGEPSAE